MLLILHRPGVSAAPSHLTTIHEGAINSHPPGLRGEGTQAGVGP